MESCQHLGLKGKGRWFPKSVSAGAIGKPAPQDQWGNTAIAKPAQQGGRGNKHPHFSFLLCNLLLCLCWPNPKGSQRTGLTDTVQKGPPLDTEEGREGCRVAGESKCVPLLKMGSKRVSSIYWKPRIWLGVFYSCLILSFLLCKLRVRIMPTSLDCMRRNNLRLYL